MFIIALTALIYLLVLRIFNGEKLKNMINYIQIILAIAVFAGYQLIIRIFNLDVLDTVYDFTWWHALLPPVWFAAPFELVMNGNLSASTVALSCMVILIPVIAIILYYYLMPVFERDLQKLLQSSSNKKKRHLIMLCWQFIVCRNALQRLYYRFAYRIVSEEREFKLKVYPSLGMGIIFPFIFLLNDFGSGSLQDMAESKAYFTIYFFAHYYWTNDSYDAILQPV